MGLLSTLNVAEDVVIRPYGAEDLPRLQQVRAAGTAVTRVTTSGDASDKVSHRPHGRLFVFNELGFRCYRM